MCSMSHYELLVVKRIYDNVDKMQKLVAGLYVRRNRGFVDFKATFYMFLMEEWLNIHV